MIEPPDPGQPLAIAKVDEYSKNAQGFVRDGVHRWLWPGGGRVWIACASAERTFSAETYERLRLGDQILGTSLFRVGAETFALVDDGFTAEAVPT